MVLLEVRGVSKTYGGVHALTDVDARFDAGEVVAVVGDNGAGKSTLMKVIAGAVQPSAGTIRWKDEVVQLPTPEAARALGIETVFQDLALVPDFNAAENLFFGREIRRWGFLQHRQMRHETRRILERLSINLPSAKAPIRYLSGGQRQSVAIGRAMAWGKGLVILDEPTAALGVQESAKVLDLVRRLRDEGTAVIMVSHNMTQVLDTADRVVVMRRGRAVADLPAAGLSSPDVVAHIVG